MKRSASSKQWLRRHVNDPYVQRSKREGYRSRSAYKLIEIDDRDRILAPGAVIVDLGAAPADGRRWPRSAPDAKGRIVAIDLLEMEAVAGATFIRGDFSAPAGLAAVEAALAGSQADAVLSDMAPNLSGIAITDQARCMALAELARDFALSHLKPGGAFLVKVFQGAGYEEFHKSLRARLRQGGGEEARCVPGGKRRALPPRPGAARWPDTPLIWPRPLKRGREAELCYSSHPLSR